MNDKLRDIGNINFVVFYNTFTFFGNMRGRKQVSLFAHHITSVLRKKNVQKNTCKNINNSCYNDYAKETKFYLYKLVFLKDIHY